MRKTLALIFFSMGIQVFMQAQSYSFNSRNASDRFEIKTDDNGLYCLFKISERKAPVTVFRKVFLNADLTPIDSADFSIEGHANLIASGADEKYSFHAFYAKAASIEKIIFIVTDKVGKNQSRYFKTIVDFAPYFPMPVKKLKNIKLIFLPNNGSPGMILVQPYLVQGSSTYPGKIYSLSAKEGKQLWALSSPPLSTIQTTDSLLIGMTTSFLNGRDQMPFYQIDFVDKISGRLLRTIPFTAKVNGYRTVSVFTTNGHQLMIAGSEFESGNTKNGKFYMSMFNFSGEQIFDRVDSASRLSTRRLHLMGNVFDMDGNLVLVGEGWKADATRAIASTAASVLLAVTVGGYMGLSTRVDHKIDNVVFATLSPGDGKLINFKTFPVGPWYDYGTLMTEGSYVLITISNQVIIYDANEPNTPPKPFTSLNSNENLILTPTGPVVGKWKKDQYVLGRLR